MSMNPYIDYPAAAARNSMNSGTMGQLWKPTLEIVDIPAAETFSDQRALVRGEFGDVPPLSFRAGSVTFSGKGYSRVVHIHEGNIKRARSVVLAKDSRGIDHILFTVKTYAKACSDAKKLASALIPSAGINSIYSPQPEKPAMSPVMKCVSEVARAIHAKEYKWPTLLDEQLPQLPKGAQWYREFMGEFFMINFSGNLISERQIKLYIQKNL